MNKACKVSMVVLVALNLCHGTKVDGSRIQALSQASSKFSSCLILSGKIEELNLNEALAQVEAESRGRSIQIIPPIAYDQEANTEAST